MAENASIPRDNSASPASSATDSSASNPSPQMTPNQNTGLGRGVTAMDVAGYKNLFNGLAASRLGSGSGEKLTIAEKEQVSESEDVIAQYQLLFARIEKGINPNNGQDTELLVFPTLSNQFTHFLKTHRASKAVSILQAHIQGHSEIIGNSDKFLDGFATLEPTMFDGISASTVRKFGWATEIPNVNPYLVKLHLGLYHFAQVRASSHMFTQRAERGRILTRQEDLDEDKSHREQKNTDLYHYGLMQSRGDIIVAMANFYSFTKYMVNDVDKDTPTVIKALLQIVKVLNTSEGRKFGDWFANHPEVFHGILIDQQFHLHRLPV
jgi:hypothetical protein